MMVTREGVKLYSILVWAETYAAFLARREACQTLRESKARNTAAIMSM